MRFILTIAFFLLLLPLYPGNFGNPVKPGNRGNPQSPERKIVWEGIQTNQFTVKDINHFLAFKGASYNAQHLPEYAETIQLPHGTTSFHAEISNTVYINLTEQEEAIVKIKETELKVTSAIGYSRKEPYALIGFVPIRKNPNTGKLEKLISFNLKLNLSSAPAESGRLKPKHSEVHAASSVLASGNWHKIGVTQDGVYKISYSFLKNLGLNVSTLDPRNIRIYGNGGGQLPYANSAFRRDDLTENAIYITSDSIGKLTKADYILFYAQGSTRWSYLPTSCPLFHHSVNLYSDTTYYFITADLGPGKRIQRQASLSAATPVNVTSFDDYAYTEEDAVNLIQSGRRWYGDNFDIITSYNYSYSFANIDPSSPANVHVDLLARDDITSNFQVTCGATTQLISPPAVTTSVYFDDYASEASACFPVTAPVSPVAINITMQTLTAIGWLNYIEVNVRRLLQMSGDQLPFRDSKSVGPGNIARYNLTIGVRDTVWEVTDPTNVRLQTTNLNGNTLQFSLAADSLRQFIAFNGNSFYTPVAAGFIPNQDLHALPQADLVIITNPMFWNAATTLANYHQTTDHLKVAVVTNTQIYNEFSSGAQDVSAIRDFMKMFYDRSTSYANMPKYLELFGDGSYDNLYRLTGNTNYIPTWQSENSHDPTASYVSDDFYGLLDNTEGDYGALDLVDIGIGRLPADNEEQARDMVNKIIRYSAKPPSTLISSPNLCSNTTIASAYGDWRNTISFVADTYPPDGQIHEQQANQLATYVDSNYLNINVNKIYLDAFPVVTTPGGDTYPAAQAAIDQCVDKGTLIMNYTGHGGPLGWSHDRVLGFSDINGWNNINMLPLFITATCEFSQFDNPAQTSGGEYIILSAGGGGIGLFTTVRLVYSNPNFVLNSNFYVHAFDTIAGGQQARLGDLFRLTKIASGYNTNNRNFTFLGDPAVRLSSPQYNVATDSINVITTPQHPPLHKLTAVITDTLKALSTVRISGHLTDKNGNLLNTFNGYLFPTVYDKPATINTLGTEAVGIFSFRLQNNILFKGMVSVTNGQFHFSFIVPKDIEYRYGIGRISYYAQSNSTDASGNCEQFYIGGTSKNTTVDNQGPGVKLYMNDTKFVFGGTTDGNPFLYAMLKDSSGINTVGIGIGHDLTAVLDGNTANTIVLNDYFQYDLNSFRSGNIHYPIQGLSPGKHTLLLKVWDIYNNSSTAYTEFYVAVSTTLTMTHVLNYPNPFTTKTSFFFEDNRCCDQLDVQIQIFTVTGKVVKNINQKVTLEGFRSDPINWDGKDEYGDNIGRGVYVYHLKIRSTDGSIADHYDKLVIL